MSRLAFAEPLLRDPAALLIAKVTIMLALANGVAMAARRFSAARPIRIDAAHACRGDCLSQAIGRLTCALFWFHPLAWRAFARLRDEAERAADDCVLQSGIPAVEYAAHLLELARRLTNARPNLVAVGIVSTTHLERRFVAMFDTKRSRAGVTSRAKALSTTFALAMICPFASLRMAAVASQPHPSSVSRAATADFDASRFPPTNVPAAIVFQPAPENSRPPISVVDNPTPSTIVHPDMSGRWASDTLGLDTPEFEFIVIDSATIKQSGDAI